MILLPIGSLSLWSMVLSLAAHLSAGILLGLVYFRIMCWNARLFRSGARMTTAIALILGRFAGLGGVLALASLEGAIPLLLVALGVLTARSLVVHKVREAAP